MIRGTIGRLNLHGHGSSVCTLLDLRLLYSHVICLFDLSPRSSPDLMKCARAGERVESKLGDGRACKLSEERARQVNHPQRL